MKIQWKIDSLKLNIDVIKPKRFLQEGKQTQKKDPKSRGGRQRRLKTSTGWLYSRQRLGVRPASLLQRSSNSPVPPMEPNGKRRWIPNWGVEVKRQRLLRMRLAVSQCVEEQHWPKEQHIPNTRTNKSTENRVRRIIPSWAPPSRGAVVKMRLWILSGRAPQEESSVSNILSIVAHRWVSPWKQSKRNRWRRRCHPATAAPRRGASSTVTDWPSSWRTRRSRSQRTVRCPRCSTTTITIIITIITTYSPPTL